jgi:hypothetical protein
MQGCLRLQVPVEQLRDQRRLPGLHPDRSRITRPVRIQTRRLELHPASRGLGPGRRCPDPFDRPSPDLAWLCHPAGRSTSATRGAGGQARPDRVYAISVGGRSALVTPPGAVRLRLPVAGHGKPEQPIGRAMRHLLAHGAGEVEVTEPLARLAVVLKGIVD